MENEDEDGPATVGATGGTSLSASAGASAAEELKKLKQGELVSRLAAE